MAIYTKTILAIILFAFVCQRIFEKINTLHSKLDHRNFLHSDFEVLEVPTTHYSNGKISEHVKEVSRVK